MRKTAQILHDPTELVQNRPFLYDAKMVPTLLKSWASDQLHIYENIVFIINPPAKELWRRDFVTENLFDHPEVLCLASCNMRAEFNDQIEIFEYDRPWLSTYTNILG